MRTKLILVMIALSVMVTGCAQRMSRDFGGASSIDLPKGEKLMLVTWKGDSLWTLTEPMENGYHAKVYKYREHSAHGVLQGTVTIREHEWAGK